MKIVTTVAFLHLWSYATAGVSGSTETVVTASPGDIALLPCYTAGNVTPSLTTWMKNGGEVIISGGPSTPTPTPTPPAVQRLIVLHDGSLNIQGVRAGDEGSYLCNSSMQGNITYHGRVLLQVVSGPENVSLSVGAATALPNGTLYTCLGSTVNLNCSGSSYPSQQLTLAFRGASSSNDSLVSTSGSWLDYKITDIQPSAQGVYSCLAQNPVSGQRVNKSTELLVYYASDRHPECMWVTAQDPYHIVFNCSWFGVYPTPTLRWDEDEGVQGGQWKGRIYATETADSLSVTLNRSQMFDGQMVRCMAQHPAIHAGDVKKCDFTLRRPFPEGDPLVTALEASSVTLTCTDQMSIPSSNTTWRKGLQQDEIVPGSKYLLSQEGYTWKLTILNVSKDDEGPYFCRSENPLDVRELEVYLTVKTSSAYTGAIIGVFIAAVIVGSAIIIAKTVYSSRHRICLGGGFGQVEDDRGDVLSLVESDDEQMFQDAVPRLPPLTNGQHTTLVQIHRIPSSDHEDAETTDTSSQQQQQQHEETKLTEEPVESLVTF